ncbi:MAG: SUMF1/EgtB/PvdO family nonheme iron enzyme [Bacteroidales bacterium]|nr:SUMF1/EgtB/PvdO family nonheme iron enzyme [Bacteroidales bacterium]
MPDKHYDIFISYRREGGKNYARVIKPELEKRGFKVFLDFDELKDGKFDQRILDAIDDAPIFMLILSNGCLDRCVNDDDWVRQEILHADRSGKHIVPVEVDKSFRQMPDIVPDDVKNVVGQHQFSQVDTETLLTASMDELVHYRIRPYITVAVPESEGAEIHVETDADCAILRFQKALGIARVGEDAVVRLKKGKHKLEFVSLKVDSVRQSNVVEVPDNDYSDFIEVRLKDKLDAIDRTDKVYRVGGVEFKMVYVEGGTFTMGATAEQGDDAYDDEKPAHKVTLSGYHIGEVPVTQALWKAVMGGNPSSFKGYDNPVEVVDWDECQEFVEKLNKITGEQFRLPTEAEWEYAARGGNRSRGYKYAGSNNIDEVAWYDGNSDNNTHPVRQKKANELNLYDMSGNVWEWCNDLEGNYGDTLQTNPTGPTSGFRYIVRGGSWFDDATHCRVSFRDNHDTSNRCNDLGFRLAR